MEGRDEEEGEDDEEEGGGGGGGWGLGGGGGGGGGAAARLGGGGARRASRSRVVIQREPSLARARRDDAMTRVRRAMEAFRAIADPLERYVYLRELQRASAETFYRALVREPLELMPFVYTPTVGEACEKYHRLGIETNGVYITADDAGRVGAKLRGHWDRAAAAGARGRAGGAAGPAPPPRGGGRPPAPAPRRRPR